MQEDTQLLSALSSLHVSDLTRAEWLAVGMALKQEGFPCSVWDEWSQADSRYKSGECERLWQGFRGTSNPVAGGTIIQMAKDRGWQPELHNRVFDWDDYISYDGDADYTEVTDDYDGIAELRTYLTTLFEPDDIVAYTTTDVYCTEDGRWVPKRGVYSRTAGELIASLDKYPEDIAMTIGDYHEEAGAWIRFNTFDGAGVTNNNVVTFKYALVESDTLPIEEQKRLYKELELPIAAMVYSGGKSMHAIVKVDAKDAKEYRERVLFLYDYLNKNGVDVDKQNNNPSRLSRMPGVIRNGKNQYLAGVNLGRKNWADWLDFVEGNDDDLPAPVAWEDLRLDKRPQRDELIGGILRCGHKMTLTGPSKAGKSFMLMELAINLATGTKFLGRFQCRRSKVLYINLEIDEISAKFRLFSIVDRFGMDMAVADGHLTIWNMRGHAKPMDILAKKLINHMMKNQYDVVILDPIYKVITGDENNASDMGQFCNQFDKICTETGAAVIVCHHFSKGAQGNKKAQDRGSGSGVFARDPDALLVLTELEMTEDIKNNVRDGHETAWRLETSLREFPNIEPLDIWFDYPIHRVANEGELTGAYIAGSSAVNLTKNSKNTTATGRKRAVENAYDALFMNNIPPSVKDMADYMQVSERCARDRVKELGDMFLIKNNLVFKKAESDDED